MLFEKIQSQLPHLSEAKKNVAHYLLDNWLEALFLPASKVARQAKVSESVVVRFAQDLGYSGFPELQQALQDILKTRLVGASMNTPPSEGIVLNQDESYQNVLDLSMNNLRTTFNHNEVSTYEQFVDNIFKARRIVILARNNSLGPAYLLNVHLNEVFSNAQVLNGESAETIDIIKGLSKEDLIINISIPRYSKRMLMISNFAKERNIPQISITNSNNNSFAKNSEAVLITSVSSLSYSNSHLATIFIIDYILHLITTKGQGKTLKSLEELEVLGQRFGFSTNE
ncbi:MurR/RpiR family transcriptional regulator [Sutcliffiella sp. NC1]|uniref:MurR/RpiR family transcriptional regulator n=1 Tax=Sutcliffiella sp. NC1 TaxID=3004096 RepID=UPI0022DE2C4E|nr:MurR/RpiR family transcriptional regulator [Sutcliffiella sp. NC1]WBL14735.1 MurR/RpiR family transcriptional regulator [Sutcliffiella sp. NC1]